MPRPAVVDERVRRHQALAAVFPRASEEALAAAVEVEMTAAAGAGIDMAVVAEVRRLLEP